MTGTPLLHGFAFSHNTRKVLAVAHHLGVAIELKSVNLLAKETSTDAFKAMNPNALSPVLIDGTLTLWDAAEIARGEALVAKAAPVLDRHLSDRIFVAGHNLTLADYALAAVLEYHHIVGYPIAHFANVLRWHAEVRDTAGWQATEPPWEQVGLARAPRTRALDIGQRALIPSDVP
ncbi:MAG TPA: glutathione S-transferase family protein [Steroidobacteraceae bacterium]|nr:glutathione S-transferase family protein [Steroidobacteraceae bacterium]